MITPHGLGEIEQKAQGRECYDGGSRTPDTVLPDGDCLPRANFSPSHCTGHYEDRPGT